MAGASFKLNSGQFTGAMDRAIKHFANRELLACRIGEALVTSTKDRFKSESGPDGEKWPKSARAEAEGGQTLTDTARLKNSIGYEATPNSVAVGTNVEYGAIHQFGGEIKPKSATALKFKVGDQFVTTDSVQMPARPFLGFSDDDAEEVKEISREWIAEGFKK